VNALSQERFFRRTDLPRSQHERAESLKHRPACGETGQSGIFLERNIDSRFTPVFLYSPRYMHT
jgi:hypothetical protein